MIDPPIIKVTGASERILPTDQPSFGSSRSPTRRDLSKTNRRLSKRMGRYTRRTNRVMRGNPPGTTTRTNFRPMSDILKPSRIKRN